MRACNRASPTSVRLGEVDTIEYQRDRGLGITVYFGKKKGSASTADLRPRAVRDMVEKACSIARHTAADDCAGLARSRGAGARYSRILICITPGRSRRIRPSSWRATARPRDLRCDARLTNSEGASVTTPARSARARQFARVSSQGFAQHQPQCELRAPGRGGRGHAARLLVFHRAQPARLCRTRGDRAARRAARAARLSARKLSTRHAPCCLRPSWRAASSRTSWARSAARASTARPPSCWMRREQAMFPAFLQMRERPHIKQGLASSPFDDEGVRNRRPRSGAAPECCRATCSAATRRASSDLRRPAMPAACTISGVCLVAMPARHSRSSCSAWAPGLLVTELMGQGVNGVTGDYSRGASGFWVEDGAIAFPVHEVTIAGNLRSCSAADRRRRHRRRLRGGLHTGSVLVEDMTIAGD